MHNTRLYIQCLSGEVLPLEFEHLQSYDRLMVCEVKLEIMDQYRIPTARERLIFADEVLKDGRRLVSYNIWDGYTIHLMQITPSVSLAWEEPDEEEDHPDDDQEEPDETDDEGDDGDAPPPPPPPSGSVPPSWAPELEPRDNHPGASVISNDMPNLSHRLNKIFTNDAEAAAIYEYYLLSHGQSPCGLARQQMRIIEDNFKHINFPEILRISLAAFPEYFAPPECTKELGAGRDTAKLYIQCLSGELLTLEFEDEQELRALLVCEVKLEIECVHRIPRSQQELIYDDQVLSDGWHLRSWNITSGSTIHLLQVATEDEFRGGSSRE